MSQKTQEKALNNFVAAAAALREAYVRQQSDPDDAAKRQAVEDARVVLANAARVYQEELAAPRAPTDTEKKDDDPTAEEEALEFDGTRTDQLDNTYRVHIASTSEDENAESDDLGQSHTTDSGTLDFPAPVDDGGLHRDRKSPQSCQQ